MSKTYAKMPSEILSIDDEYTSFCFNEACTFIRLKMENGEEINFEKNFNSFTDMYKKLGL
jgi:hypothetical protein